MKRIVALTIVLLSALISMAQQDSFPLPEVPCRLTTPTERANYLALHYWDHYDFTDNTLIGNQDVSEQGFYNYISIMSGVTQQREAFDRLAGKITRNDKMLNYFLDLADQYLAESHSPLYDEELYIIMLNSILSVQHLDATKRIQVQYKLDMAMKNRIGEVAADITMLLRDGTYTTLSSIKSNQYILLYMGNPDCNVCNFAKHQLLASAIITHLVSCGDLAIISLCIEGCTQAWQDIPAPGGWIDACDENQAIYEEEIYDIAQVPSFYLLDHERKVILRDVHVEYLLQYLSSQKNVFP